MSVHVTLLRASALDLRANLEAKLRCLTSIETSLKRFADDAAPQALQDLANHLAMMRELHHVSTDIIQVATTGLESLLSQAGETLSN
jgi:hypothetical protein